MVEYGIWDDKAADFIETQLYSLLEANKRLIDLCVESPDSVDDLFVKEICPEHEKQSADYCEYCNHEVENDEPEND